MLLLVLYDSIKKIKYRGHDASQLSEAWTCMSVWTKSTYSHREFFIVISNADRGAAAQPRHTVILLCSLRSSCTKLVYDLTTRDDIIFIDSHAFPFVRQNYYWQSLGYWCDTRLLVSIILTDHCISTVQAIKIWNKIWSKQLFKVHIEINYCEWNDLSLVKYQSWICMSLLTSARTASIILKVR